MVQRLKKRDNAKTMRRVNFIGESDKEEESKEEQLVLRVDREGSKPFHMERTMGVSYF